MLARTALIRRLRAKDVPEVLIIGGGINGVGAYRDLAAQGVAALLVEAGDFSSGTSAAPSRLIHGGLRYLETGEAALVRESLTERNLLLKNACHVVHPIPCWVPLRSWLGGSVGAVLRFLRLKRTPGKKGAVPVKIGLMLYDRFGRVNQTMPDHRMLNAAQARAEVGILAPDIRVVGEYYDARISHPERLVMELVADAEADCPLSMAVPYLAAGAQGQGRITLTCQITGEVFEVTPKIVINASGAWVDGVQADLGLRDRLIGGTRGSHLVLRHRQLAEALDDKMLYFETDDHRACLIYRLAEDRVLLGTTDIRSDDPGDKQCTEAEVDYLFKVLKPILPGITLSRADIVFAFAGVRPLPKAEVGATGAISRDHRLVQFARTPDRPFDLITLVGGKWTTYRVCAEQMADAVLQKLGRKRAKDTTGLAIGGAAGLPVAAEPRRAWVAALARETGLPLARCQVLAVRYGSRARAVALAERAAPEAFAHLAGYTPAEIRLICTDERVTRLQDIVLRRTLMGFEGHGASAALAELAQVAGAVLGWDAVRIEQELDATLELLRNRHMMAIA